ncbi:ABC transporter ATP-binding protein [Candidatus Caldarchaeum subterraneum]|uniref:ABC transport system ATP-binding protein n=1 Tax=Caldiarchaeum subterraneum TaxID=311458 RepID=Q4LED4_CALS0|nr:ABC transporter ATP-binding protein [Candidatus Caldarchaeum subterraneum]BAJ48955.1 ABC transport system ATP-binding protein [Candidatus Caldarchaeum subterraneum]BAJ51580.1 ABC transporter ATP-binding protein [Candidatus Caldarchaeum subterraneum]
MGLAAETVNLGRVFRNRGSMVQALEKVNLRIEKGQIYGLLGPNGAGKTTLVKILTTLLLPTTGEAYVYGYDVSKEASKIRPLINLVSGADTPGYGLITVRENLWFYSMLYGLDKETAKERINRLVEEVGLKEVENELLRNLSTGYRQRMNLARGLVNDPLVLFLDEPTIGLDAVSARRIRRLIKDWVRVDSGRTVILTSHYMAEVEEMCARVAVLNKGRVVAEGTPAELRSLVAGKTVAVMEVWLPTDAEHVLDKLESAYRTHDPATNIYRIRVVVNNWDETADIVEHITSHGGKVLSLVKAMPSFEDVYVKLVGGGEVVSEFEA